MTNVKASVIEFIEAQFHVRGIPARHQLEGRTDEYVTGEGDDQVCHLRTLFFTDEKPEADLSFLQSASPGMGLVAMAGIVAALRKAEYERLYLIEIMADGFSFWPWLGAVAADGRAPNADHVAQAVGALQGKGAIDAAEAKRLTTNVFNLEAVQGREAWHKLASLDHPTKTERAVIGEVTKLALPHKIMVLDLTDPKVNATLEKRFSGLRPPSHKA